jgi:hypothetical protein
MVPTRSADQRASALEAALAARRERARLRAALKSGDVTAGEVLEGARENPQWASLKVTWLLESVPGIGQIRAERIMTSLGIAASRRIKGLGERQRTALAAELAARG